MSSGEKTEAITLGTLSGKLDMVVDSVGTLNTNIVNLTQAQAETSSSVKSSWRDINELKRDVKKMPGKWKRSLQDHEKECIPRQKARSRALTTDTDTAIRRPDESQQFDVPPLISPSRNSIPLRWVIIGGIVICISLLVTGIVIGSTVQGAPAKAGETIKTLAEQGKKK